MPKPWAIFASLARRVSPVRAGVCRRKRIWWLGLVAQATPLLFEVRPSGTSPALQTADVHEALLQATATMQNRSRNLALAIFVTVLLKSHVLLAQGCSGEACKCQHALGVVSQYRHGRWFVLETDNFQVCCERSAVDATHLARHAEKLRKGLRSKWLGSSSEDAWNPRCQIVLHGTRASYAAAVGRGSEHTVGSSLVRASEGRIVAWRIDLLGGQTEFLSAALPHELTHIVLREQFTSSVPPRWADEGAAILADPITKQGRHSNDLAKALARRDLFRTGELLTMIDYPRSDRMGAFYGQSAALAKFLVDRVDAERFVEFVERAKVEGYDAALRKCYGIDGVPELDRQWRQQMYQVQTATPAG